MTDSVRAASAGLVLVWREPGIEGYRDYFPPGWLDRPGQQKHVHEVIGPRGSRGLATYALRVLGKQVELDYHRFAATNIRGGFDIGWMIIKFSDAERSKVAEVRWRDEAGKEDGAKVEATYDVPQELPPYEPRAGRRVKATSRKDRSGQERFRVLVRAAYGDRCCLTDCDVPEALEATHIDQHQNESQHHPANGLLLRKDLHALFDAGLAAIEPRTRRVVFAKEVARDATYRRLHRRRAVRPPEKGYDSYAPAPTAIETRWDDFSA